MQLHTSHGMQKHTSVAIAQSMHTSPYKPPNTLQAAYQKHMLHRWCPSFAFNAGHHAVIEHTIDAAQQSLMAFPFGQKVPTITAKQSWKAATGFINGKYG